MFSPAFKTGAVFGLAITVVLLLQMTGAFPRDFTQIGDYVLRGLMVVAGIVAVHRQVWLGSGPMTFLGRIWSGASAGFAMLTSLFLAGVPSLVFWQMKTEGAFAPYAALNQLMAYSRHFWVPMMALAVVGGVVSILFVREEEEPNIRMV